MVKLRTAAAALALLSMAAPQSAALAQAAPSRTAPPTPSTADYSRAVEQIERLVRENYVDSAKKPGVLKVLEAGRRSGRYAGAGSPDVFAARVTEDLQRASQDGHMYINWSPDQHRALSQRTGAVSADSDAFWRERARRENSGLVEQRVLPGNVRYLKLKAFLWDDQLSPPVYDAAMRFLNAGEAAIIDLRGNGGGSPDAVNYLTSHFVPGGTKLMTFVMREGEEISTARDALPAGRLSGKPVYVLIDKGVASAGEEFALHVDKFRFGQLVGETTAGDGNRNELYPVAPGFLLSVSVGLAKHGTDGSGWQGAGIKPQVAVAPGRALETAHAHALRKLAEAAPAERRAEYAWLAETARARAEPVALSPETLTRYAGAYGDRKVSVQDGALVYQREGGAPVRLVPIGGDRFLFGPEDGVRISFDVKDGRPAAVVVSYSDGRSSRFARTG
jgi:hypothetical protein